MSFNPTLTCAGLAGLYRDDTGFWARPTVDGRRCWRKLDAKTQTAAIKEFTRKVEEHASYTAGVSRSSPWKPSVSTVAGLAEQYLAAGCPGRDQDRSAAFLANEQYRIGWLVRHLGDRDPNSIRLRDLREYRDWRMRHCVHGRGVRQVELDWVTLSNVLNWGVAEDLVEFNFIRQGRDRLRKENPRSNDVHRIRHARDVAPRTADEVHRVADALFADPRSQSTGWFWLFACMTGMRRGELLRLRMDAPQGTPGFVGQNHLYIARSKQRERQEWQYIELHDALRDCVECHRNWHAEFGRGNPFYFPGEGGGPLHFTTPSQAIPTACARLGLPRMTPHGARSWFATSLRAQGLPDWKVAHGLGDSTVSLISRVYGDQPPEEFSYLPSEGLPAWARFRKPEEKIAAIA